MEIPYKTKLHYGRFETWTKKPEFNFLSVHQVHGTDIAAPETLPVQADGIISSWESLSLPLTIKTADCLPIVIEGEKGVSFLHAGWKGLAAGILLKPEIKLLAPTHFFIGPSIQSCCFEVSEDFRINFPDGPYLKDANGKLHFNLQLEAKKQILKEFPEASIEITPLCTACRREFHSWRRDKTQERNWNLYIKG